MRKILMTLIAGILVSIIIRALFIPLPEFRSYHLAIVVVIGVVVLKIATLAIPKLKNKFPNAEAALFTLIFIARGIIEELLEEEIFTLLLPMLHWYHFVIGGVILLYLLIKYENLSEVFSKTEEIEVPPLGEPGQKLPSKISFPDFLNYVVVFGAIAFFVFGAIGLKVNSIFNERVSEGIISSDDLMMRLFAGIPLTIASLSSLIVVTTAKIAGMFGDTKTSLFFLICGVFIFWALSVLTGFSINIAVF